MSYPPQEGYPPPATQHHAPLPPAPQPTVSFPAQPPAMPSAPAYSPAPSQISGTPYSSPEPRRPPTVLVLAIAAGLLLVFGGLMLGLYLNERGNLNDTKGNLRDTRADLTAQVQEQKTIVTGEQEKLTKETKRADDLDAQVKDMKPKLTEMTEQNTVLVPCMRRVQEMFDAASTGDNGGTVRALRQSRAACDKAERKVDS